MREAFFAWGQKAPSMTAIWHYASGSIPLKRLRKNLNIRIFFKSYSLKKLMENISGVLLETNFSTRSIGLQVNRASHRALKMEKIILNTCLYRAKLVN